MAYRELHVIEIKEILRLWAMGRGLRTIASRTGTDRKTVRRYVEAAEAAGLMRGDTVSDEVVAEVVSSVMPGGSTEVGEAREKCREHRELLAGWVAEGCKSPKLRRLLARHAGVRVPLRTLQRFVAEELAEPDEGTVRVVDGKPGELEIDFLLFGKFTDAETGRERKMHGLLCTAAYSRHQFVWPCLREGRNELIEGLEAAWRFFGGVFPVVIGDNPKAAVDKADELAPQINPEFLEYLQERGIEADLARVRSPRDKARVERQVSYVRNDFWRGERFGSVVEAQEEAVRWSQEMAGLRTHGTTRRAPIEHFEAEERSLLLPAPEAPYDRPRWTTHQVGRDHAVMVGYALYSVPYQLGCCEIQARSDSRTVKLYHKRVLVKVHPRQPEGGAHLDAADMPPRKAALATRDPSSLLARATKHGEHVGRFAGGLLEGPLPWTRMRHVYRLLRLADQHGAELLEEACSRSLEVGVVDVTRLARMLERGLVKRTAAEPPAPAAPAPRRPAQKLRFARSASEFRTEATDARS
jgi:transposase